MLSGIYEIRNILNNHIYIGSSKDITVRWTMHINGLRHNKHNNIYLQNAWNKYGECNFTFKILLLCDESTLRLFEQRCIDYLNPEYNLAKIATGGRKSKKYRMVGLISPNGEVFYDIENLFQFCKEKNLPNSAMHNLINGDKNRKSYKGWTILEPLILI